MADIITMLALSPTMEEGTIAEWHKKEGDTVEEGEIIAEVETDKATMEMESFFEGTVLRVLVKPGDTVKVGAPMAVIGEPGEDVDAALGGGGGGGGERQSDDGDGGDSAEEGERPAAREDEAPVNQVEEAEEAPAERAEQTDRGASSGRVIASPLARKIAEDKGIDLKSLKGSGPGGRIIKQDVEGAKPAAQRAEKPAAASAGKAEGAKPAAAAHAPSTEPTVIGELPDASASLEPMSQMRKAIARRMVQVWQNTPFFYLTMDIDMGAAMAQRAQLNEQLKAAGIEVKISVNDMIVRACALALRDYPRMNCAFAGDSIAYFGQVHVGVAVALEDGLITPTLRDADKKTLSQIALETRDLAGKARDKKLKPGEFGGSTFSISNLGMYGIDHFQAVINPPESAILACGAVQQVPVVKDGELTVGTRMKITLTCDHRAVDGAIGAEFLQHVKKRLESPILLMV